MEKAELTITNGASSSLALYETMRQAVAECRTVAEAKDMRARASALGDYARKAGDKELGRWCAEIRLWAGRKAGQLLVAMAEAGERANKGQSKEMSKPTTLSDLGITRDQSSMWQRLTVPETDADFEAILVRTWDKYGELTDAAVLREIGRDENDARLARIRDQLLASIDGRYDVMVFDPPWPVVKIERDERPLQTGLDYPTQTVEEITTSLAELVTNAADDCHVFLWTTNKYLPDAIAILKAIEAKYVCTFVWHKPGGFQPHGLPQYNCEFALYARIGTPKFIETRDFPLCFEAPRGAHSEKPEVFYERLRRTTAGRRLDAHSRRPIEGFERGGNEP